MASVRGFEIAEYREHPSVRGILPQVIPAIHWVHIDHALTVGEIRHVQAVRHG